MVRMTGCPDRARPRSRRVFSVWPISIASLSASGAIIGSTPQWRQAGDTSLLRVMPMIVAAGRYSESSRAQPPESEMATIAGASTKREATTAACATALAVTRIIGQPAARSCDGNDRFPRPRRMIRSIVRTAKRILAGAVSPDSMTASVESKMALATSLASARVGRGVLVIDSSIWVAVITSLPRAFAKLDGGLLRQRHFSGPSSTRIAASDHDAVWRHR